MHRKPRAYGTHLVTLLVSALVAFSGCIAAGPNDNTTNANDDDPLVPYDDESNDATNMTAEPKSARFANMHGGAATPNHPFVVADNSPGIEIVASWSTGGVTSFVLLDPDGEERQRSDAVGGDYVTDQDWYSDPDPKAGTWTLEIAIAGGATYEFDVTY